MFEKGLYLQGNAENIYKNMEKMCSNDKNNFKEKIKIL